MGKRNVSRKTREHLVKHLLWVEEEREHVLETYYFNEPERRDELRSFLVDYAQHIEDFVQDINLDESLEASLPFSVIGSLVEVEDVANDERISFHIISPFSSNQEIDESENFASYLSPVGKALLLKEPGDQVIVETPSMIQEYRIKSFRFP